MLSFLIITKVSLVTLLSRIVPPVLDLAEYILPDVLGEGTALLLHDGGPQDGTNSTAFGERTLPGPAVEEARGPQVARTRRINDLSGMHRIDSLYFA
jgi:hypothetical protein